MSPPDVQQVQRVVLFSGGIGSWAAAARVADRERAAGHGTARLTLLFTDTLMEDGDLYRFLIEGACQVLGLPRPAGLVDALAALPEFHVDREARVAGLAAARARAAESVPGLVWLAEGRDPFEVFRAERMLGNSRVDPCSKLLKREPTNRWLTANRDPQRTVVSVGIDWTEVHRYTAIATRRGGQGWTYDAPLCERPYVTKPDLLRAAREAGLAPPRLYGLGLAHNNCGSFCIKAGQGHYALVHRVLPDRYAFYEAQEEGMRTFLGRDVAMLTDRSGDGKKKPLPLRVLRERLEAPQVPGPDGAPVQLDLFDVGGCGCFATPDAPDVPEEAES
jgi:hypothetical protein